MILYNTLWKEMRDYIDFVRSRTFEFTNKDGFESYIGVRVIVQKEGFRKYSYLFQFSVFTGGRNMKMISTLINVNYGFGKKFTYSQRVAGAESLKEILSFFQIIEDKAPEFSTSVLKVIRNFKVPEFVYSDDFPFVRSGMWKYQGIGKKLKGGRKMVYKTTRSSTVQSDISDETGNTISTTIPGFLNKILNALRGNKEN